MDIADATCKRALLLHYAGDDVKDIFDSLTDVGDDAACDAARGNLRDISSRKRTKYTKCTSSGSVARSCASFFASTALRLMLLLVYRRLKLSGEGR